MALAAYRAIPITEGCHPIARLRRQVFRCLETWPGYAKVTALLDRFPQMDLYLAGGAIRNQVLGVAAAPKDFDFFFAGVATASIENWLRRASGKVTTTAYGSPRWYPEEGAAWCEFIPIESFGIAAWPRRTMVDILHQFDFTGNALAFDLRTKRFHDPVGGYRDLRRGILRAVRFDFPAEPLKGESHVSRAALHWVRCLHYAATLRLTIEPATMRWLRAHQHYGTLDFGRFFRNTQLNLSRLPPSTGPLAERLRRGFRTR